MHPYAKTIASFIAVVAGALLTVLTGDMTPADLTWSQWLGVIVLVFGTPAAVYGVENDDTPSHR